MQKWEYGTLRRTRTTYAHKASPWSIEPIEPTLTIWGQEGWELVCMTSEAGQTSAAGAGFTSEEVWVFKRPLPDSQ
ncbi:MAG: hypothetical protein EOP06_29745 [Proteobacteria bacterium]|nr:MAG: hypothetical protein EOP06_29745 [Pseudomonadota bacterium]